MSHKVALYANSRPRLATYLPLARAIINAGHECDLYCPLSCQATEQEREGYLDVPLNFIQTNEVRKLHGYNLFVSPEKAHDSIPERTRSIAILHSLPDRDLLKTSYAHWLKPHSYISKFDYFFVAVKQSPSQWRAENYIRSGGILPSASTLSKDFTVVPGGYPKLEYLSRALLHRSTRDCILYCPTKSDNSVSEVAIWGAEIIRRIHEAYPGFSVVFRPYPTDEPKVVEEVCAAIRGLPRVIIDRSVTGLDLQRRCVAMVTDRSSVAITFSLASRQPSVFFSVGDSQGSDLLKEEIIGFNAVGWPALLAALDHCVNESNLWEEKIRIVLDERLYNPLSAATYLAKNVPVFANGETLDGWLTVPR